MLSPSRYSPLYTIHWFCPFFNCWKYTWKFSSVKGLSSDVVSFWIVITSPNFHPRSPSLRLGNKNIDPGCKIWWVGKLFQHGHGIFAKTNALWMQNAGVDAGHGVDSSATLLIHLVAVSTHDLTVASRPPRRNLHGNFDLQDKFMMPNSMAANSFFCAFLFTLAHVFFSTPCSATSAQCCFDKSKLCRRWRPSARIHRRRLKFSNQCNIFFGGISALE